MEASTKIAYNFTVALPLTSKLNDYKSKQMLAQWESQKTLKIKQAENTTWHLMSKVKKKNYYSFFVLISKKIIRGKQEVFPQGLLFVFWETAGKKK